VRGRGALAAPPVVGDLQQGPEVGMRGRGALAAPLAVLGEDCSRALYCAQPALVGRAKLGSSRVQPLSLLCTTVSS